MLKISRLLATIVIVFGILSCNVSGGGSDDGNKPKNFDYTYHVNKVGYEAYSLNEITFNIETNAKLEYQDDYFAIYLSDENFVATLSADGYHTRTIKVAGVADEVGKHVYGITLFPASLPKTTVSGQVSYINSVAPVKNVVVQNCDGDLYDTVLTDSEGKYSFDIYHKGEISLSFDRDDLISEIHTISTEKFKESIDCYLTPDGISWTSFYGQVKDGYTGLEGALVTLGDFTTTTGSDGSYYNLFLPNGTSGTLTVTHNGYTKYAEVVSCDAKNSYVSIDKNVSLEKQTTAGSPVLGSVTISGLVTNPQGTPISGGSVTIGGVTVNVTDGSYSILTDTTATEGNVIIQVGMFMDYNLYGHTIKAMSANINHNIVLYPTLDNTITTTFSGYILDSSTGIVPADLTGFTLSANAQTATINPANGHYSVTVPNHMGSVIFMGAGTNYHLTQRTVGAPTTDTVNYDISFDPE